MEFTAEFIQETGLNETQIQKITEVVDGHIVDLKNEMKGDANKNAEIILTQASDALETLTGIKREEKQKLADYTKFAVEKYFEGTKSSLERKQKELETKLKEGTGDEQLKAQLQEVNTELDKYKQKAAQFADYEENDYKTMYTETLEKLNTKERVLAFAMHKPKFADNINKYEADHKWAAFQKETLEKFTLKIDDSDNTVYLTDKTNEYKTVKLADYIEKNEVISALVKGREIDGFDTKKKDKLKIEGVPFEVPANATAKERQDAIKDYLLNVLKLSQFTDEYSKKYAEFNQLILGKTPAK
jgi:hypothetical protein